MLALSLRVMEQAPGAVRDRSLTVGGKEHKLRAAARGSEPESRVPPEASWMEHGSPNTLVLVQ